MALKSKKDQKKYLTHVLDQGLSGNYDFHCPLLATFGTVAVRSGLEHVNMNMLMESTIQINVSSYTLTFIYLDYSLPFVRFKFSGYSFWLFSNLSSFLVFSNQFLKPVANHNNFFSDTSSYFCIKKNKRQKHNKITGDIKVIVFLNQEISKNPSIGL